MEQRRQQKAQVALNLATQDGWTNEDLATALGGYPEAAEASTYLVGFLLETLALHRGEDVKKTAKFVRHLLERGSDGLGGSREPRQPPPISGPGGEQRKPK